MKKVLSAISDYYSDVLGMHPASDFKRPDAAKVAEGAGRDAGRILQLLLGCAINCDGKQAYIESIMSMGEAEQQVIMTAIQELMADVQAPGAAAPMAMEAAGMAEALADANREREALKQKLHEMEGKIKLVEDEKNNLAAEYETFQKKVG